jgi:cyclohexanone monooxygenase
MSEAVTEPTLNHIPTPEELGFDPGLLREKYAAERAKRLRSDGNSQFQEISGQFERFNVDPYIDPGFTRDALHEDLEVAIIGGGFGGMLAAVRLQEVEISNFRIIEKAGDFGGTWYWNRYPGAQCDVEGYLYLPLLEETGYIPKERYSFAPEIFAHAQRIGKHFNLYEKACFQTRIKEARWDDEAGRWTVTTDRGDAFKTRFVIMSSGPLNKPKLPGIPGIEKFKGHTFHTSRWDYDYTGGDTTGGLHKTKGQACRDHRYRSHRDPVHTPSGRACAAALRPSAHALLGGRTEQHAHRPRMGEKAEARLAGISQSQLHRPPGRSRA